MEIFQKSKFSTAEFARLCGVGKDTLLHYDEIGVFSPAKRGENGYRYYNYQQLEVFNVIWMLKEIGMPLAEIREYCDRRSPEKFIELLDRQSVEIDERIAKLESMRDFIRKKRDLTVAAVQVDPRSVNFRTEADRYLLMTPIPDGGKKPEALSEAFLRFFDLCDEHLVAPHFIGGVIPEAEVRAGRFVDYSHLYCVTAERFPDSEVLFGGTFAVTYSDGYDLLESAYERLFRFLRDNDRTIDSGFFEDTLLDEMSVVGYNNYLLKISVRVKD